MTIEERDKYLQTECLHPKRIVNKYTHEEMYVRCGVCPSCLAHKSNVQCAYISNMASYFKYAYFFTLTYDECFIPRVKVRIAERMSGDFFDTYVPESDPRLYSRSDQNGYSVQFEYITRSQCIRTSPNGKVRILDDSYTPYEFFKIFTISELQDLMIKAHGRFDPIRKQVVYPPISECTDTIPVLNAYDQNLFFKRLRFYISKFTDEKISYYLVSEYGPRTLRPHWHGILFFNSSEIAEVICDLVSKAWLLGRADCSLSRGSAAGYVASYINSFVSIPDFYKFIPQIKPRSYHSKGFGSYSQFPKSASLREVEQVAATFFDGISVPVNDKFIQVKPSRSLERTVFPRFFDASLKDTHSCAYFYRLAYQTPYRLCRYGYISIDELSSLSLYEIARRATEWYYDYKLKLSDYGQEDITFLHYCRLDTLDLSYDCVHGKFYRMLSSVNRTIRFWNLDGLFSYELENALNILFVHSQKYWQKRDYRTLCQYYEYQEMVPESVPYLKTVTCGIDPEPTKESESFLSSIKSSIRKIVNGKIKHKEYNDLSGFLLNYN